MTFFETPPQNNQELAQAVKDLRDFLIIAGYEESHALRYTAIARTIEKMPEDARDLRAEGRLTEIPQVGKLIARYLEEILDTGRTTKLDEWLPHAPLTVLEMVRIPGLGPKTARTLWHTHRIASLADLKAALQDGRLDGVKGVGPKLREAIADFGL